MHKVVQEKTVGILGGMGPEATVDLLQRIIKLTPVLDDADHIRCIVDNDPKVPSRIQALIEHTGTSPGPYMVKMGQGLEKLGADFLAIPCNTAHHYYDDVNRAVRVPVLNIIDLACEAVLSGYPEFKKVGILASPAVVMTRLYEAPLASLKLEGVYPAPEDQELLLSVIRRVKAGDTGPQVLQDFYDIALRLKIAGAEVCVVACTELSVICKDMPLPVVDASQALALEIVNVAKYGKQPKARSKPDTREAACAMD